MLRYANFSRLKLTKRLNQGDIPNAKEIIERYEDIAALIASEGTNILENLLISNQFKLTTSILGNTFLPKTSIGREVRESESYLR